MVLGKPVKKSAPLGVFRIAAALIISAFLGAALGLVWQSSNFGGDEEVLVTVETPEG